MAFRETVIKNGARLKCGYTTGTCAAGAAKAACWMLFSGAPVYKVKVLTPKGVEITLDVEDIRFEKDKVTCAIVKDAGDDPDVTHGLKIYAAASKCAGGIHIDGGVGIGRVTKQGLQAPVGTAAINPVPLGMIKSGAEEICRKHGYAGGVEITISAPDAVSLAEKTFNPRLGIVGGISILGTTGIVEPMSEQALLRTIQLDMEVYLRNQKDGILIMAPGNYGAGFGASVLDIEMDQAVKCSNFIGDALDYACFIGFRKILLIGHTGKLIKLAAGVMNTHSKVADCRMEILAAHCALNGGNREMAGQLMGCISTDEALDLLEAWGMAEAVAASVKEKIKFHLDYRTKGAAQVEFVLFHKKDRAYLYSDGAGKMLEEVGK